MAKKKKTDAPEELKLVTPDPWPAYAGESGAPVRIRDVKVILTAPDRIRLVIVKVETTEPGLTASVAPPSPSARWQW
ncbi:MAG: hypothetical protein R2845_05535 [Thermomicrobiales bacterium]